MIGTFSVIKFCPDTLLDEGYSIGLIILSEENNFYKIRISEKKLNRLLSIFNLKKTDLLKYSIEEIHANVFDINILQKLSIYENGLIRFSKPQKINTVDFALIFDELFTKYIENFVLTTLNKDPDTNKLGQKNSNFNFTSKLKSNKVISERLNIGVELKNESFNELVPNGTKVEFIGKNGSIYSGKLLDLTLAHKTINFHFIQTFLLAKALEISFGDEFKPEGFNLLIVNNDEVVKENQSYLNSLKNWHEKAGYNLIIKENLSGLITEIENNVQKLDVHPLEIN